jgi:hypothetical protein
VKGNQTNAGALFEMDSFDMKTDVGHEAELGKKDIHCSRLLG